jgi:hypothetical protein
MSGCYGPQNVHFSQRKMFQDGDVWGRVNNHTSETEGLWTGLFYSHQNGILGY